MAVINRSLSCIKILGDRCSLRLATIAPVDDSIKPISIISSTILGVAVQILGMAVAWHSYDLKNSVSFSFRNHLVSELGWFEHSPRAAFFSVGISLGSALLIPVLVAMCSFLPVRLRVIAWVSGGLAILGGIGVGLFLMAKNLLPHLIAASLFFIGWLVAVSLFTYVLRRASSWRALVVIGTVCIFVAGLYVIVTAILAKELLQVFHSGSRPDILCSAINEWIVLLSCYVWNIAASIMLGKHHALSR